MSAYCKYCDAHTGVCGEVPCVYQERDQLKAENERLAKLLSGDDADLLTKWLAEGGAEAHAVHLAGVEHEKEVERLDNLRRGLVSSLSKAKYENDLLNKLVLMCREALEPVYNESQAANFVFGHLCYWLLTGELSVDESMSEELGRQLDQAAPQKSADPVDVCFVCETPGHWCTCGEEAALAASADMRALWSYADSGAELEQDVARRLYLAFRGVCGVE